MLNYARDIYRFPGKQTHVHDSLLILPDITWFSDLIGVDMCLDDKLDCYVFVGIELYDDCPTLVF